LRKIERYYDLLNSFIPFVVIVIVVLIVYANSLNGDFQFDDYNVIVFNPRIHSLGAWWQDAGSGIRQLLKLTYTLNWIISIKPWGFHFFNVICHVINSFLIFFLTKRFTLNTTVAFVTGIFFAVHPIQTESVTYISGRSSSLMAVFYLASLMTYARIVKPYPWQDKWVFLSVLFFFMAILVKETALSLPLILILWDVTNTYKGLNLYEMVKRQAFHWILFFSSLLFFLLFTRYSRLVAYSMNIRSIKLNLLSQLNGIADTVFHYFLLNRLNIDPQHLIISSWNLSVFLELIFLCIIILTGIFSLMPLIKKDHRKDPETLTIYRLLAFAIFWFIIQLLPVSTFIPRIDIINERHFYLAGWSIFLLSAAGILFMFKKIKKIIPLWVSVAILTTILSSYTIARNHVYRDEISLWEDTVRKSPNKARVYNNLGYAYFIAGRYEDARRAYIRALEIDSNFTLARNNLEMLYKSAFPKVLNKQDN